MINNLGANRLALLSLRHQTLSQVQANTTSHIMMAGLLAGCHFRAVYRFHPILALSSISRQCSSLSTIPALERPKIYSVGSVLSSPIRYKGRNTINYTRRVPYSSVRIIPQYRKPMTLSDDKKPAIDYKIPRPSSR